MYLLNFKISIPISYKKHPISLKLGDFSANLLNIHPIYVNWTPSSVMKTPLAIYQNLQKSTTKDSKSTKSHLQCQCENLPLLAYHWAGFIKNSMTTKRLTWFCWIFPVLFFVPHQSSLISSYKMEAWIVTLPENLWIIQASLDVLHSEIKVKEKDNQLDT